MSEFVLNFLYIIIQLSFGFATGIYMNYAQQSIFKHRVINVLIFATTWDIPFVFYYITGTKEPFSILSLILIIVFSLLLYKSNLVTRVINVVFYYIAMFSADILSYSILKINMDTSSKSFAVISAALSFFLSCAILFSFASIIKFQSKNNLKKSLLVYLLIPISQIIMFYMLSFFFYNAFHKTTLWKDDLQTFMPVIFVVLLFICLSADIWIFTQYIKNIKSEQIKAENLILEEKNKLNYQYFSDLTKNELELRKIKHDIGGSLEIVKELIYEENDINKAKHLFDELSETVKNIDTGFYCRNSLINAIITNKAKICKKENIKFDVSIMIKEEIGINDSDICRALLNILDNSIEANLLLDETIEKSIVFSMKEIDDYLYIKAVNPCKEDVVDKKTSKKDNKEHGYGLKILNSFAEKYNGNFSVTNEGNIVTSLLSMQNV